jgi:hypothetical protein
VVYVGAAIDLGANPVRKAALRDVHADALKGRLPGRAHGEQVGGRTTARVDAERVARNVAQLREPAQGSLLEEAE